MKYIWILAIILFVSINTYANDKLLIYNQNSSNFPLVSFNVYNIINNTSISLQKNDVEILENGQPISEFNINKLVDSISEKNLYVFALDLSASLTPKILQNYNLFISNFLKRVDLKLNRFAIIGFNDFVFNISSPDTSTKNLSNLITNAKYFGNTNYDSLFYSQLNVMSYRSSLDEKYQIIILNDGGGSFDDGKVNELLLAKNANLYSIAFNSINNESLKNTIIRHNGLFIDNVSNIEKVEYYSDLIYFHSKGFRPNQIIYYTNSCSIKNEIDFINTSKKTNDRFNLQFDNELFPVLEFTETNSIDFGIVPKFSSKTIKLKIKPKNQDIIINEIIDDPIFKVSGLTRNQILKKNNIYEFEVKYLPLDTNYIFKKLSLFHTGCFSSEILVSGGVPKNDDLPKNLKLLSPNGGEKINVFDSYLIKWEGILTNDTISIEFSPDNGANWDLITPKATGLNYNWINPPNLITNLGLIRIKNYSKKDEFQQIKSLKGINGNIVGLKWGKQSNQLFTGSKDGFIRLWDTEKVEPIKTILNGIINLHFFDISNDEKYLLIVDDNKKSLKVYDLQSSIFLSGYQLESEVSFLDWDDISNNFVIGTADGSISIYEYPNIIPFFEAKLPNQNISVLKFSPLGNRIAVGTSEGNIFIYHTNGQLVNQFKNSDVAVTDLSWNKSNKIISVSSTIEIVKIWDVESGINVLQINEKSKPIIKTSWSPNLKFISTINPDKSINLWKPEDASLFYSFNLHSHTASDLVWNSNGTTIASGTIEGEVLIWSVNDIPFEKLLLQEDISDAVFSLSRPSIQKNDVFLGQHTIGKSFDSTFSNFIINIGDFDISIDSIKVWGDTKENFNVLNQLPIELTMGSSIDLKINFSPLKDIVYIDTLVIFSKNTHYRCLINGIGIKNKINIEPKLLNFEKQKLGMKSTSKQFIIENLADTEIEIDDFLLDSKFGFYVENFIPNTIQPFEKRTIDVYFEPGQIGEVSTINYIKFSDITEYQYLVFNGIGIAPKINIPSNVEFPSLICENDILTKSFYLKNFGNDDLIIDTIYIQQNNSDFKLDLTSFVKTIPPSDSIEVRINYSKISKGFSSSTLYIKTNLNADGKNEFIVTLIGQKESILVELSEKEINLFADINESKLSSIRLFNKSTIPLIFNPAFNNQFFRIKSLLPIIIVPNDSTDIEVELIPINENGLFSSILSFKDTCNNLFNVTFNAYIGLRNAKISIIEELFFDTLICRNVSNSKSIIIRNNGEVPLIIEDIQLFSTGQDNFSINKSLSKKILQKDEIDSIQVFVDAVEIGLVKTDLRIYSNAENAIDGYNSVKLQSYIAYSSAKPESDTLYFDNLYENKVYHSSIKVKNNGNTNLEWNFPIIKDNFNIDSVVPNFTSPNSTSTLFISFKGGLSPNTYYQDYFFKNTCDNEQKLVLVANVNKKAALGIRAGIIKSAPGDTVELPIFLYLKESSFFPKVDYYECDLVFNGTLLIPLDYESLLDDELNRRVTIKLNAQPDNEGMIGKIRFISYLGNSDSTIIEILNSKAIGNESISIEEINGVFYLDSICYEGGPRLIGSTGILRLFQNYPNPVDNLTTIPFSIIEKGKYSLGIYDLLSNEIINTILGDLEPGTYELKYDLSNFSAGNYFYVLKTPSKTIVRKLTINR